MALSLLVSVDLVIYNISKSTYCVFDPIEIKKNYFKRGKGIELDLIWDPPIPLPHVMACSCLFFTPYAQGVPLAAWESEKTPLCTLAGHMRCHLPTNQSAEGQAAPPSNCRPLFPPGHSAGCLWEG